MEIRPFRKIQRKVTNVIKVGNINIGGTSPIVVQSMTNTLTSDIKSTVNQINQLSDAGAEVVRVSCPDKESTLALKEIVKQTNVPIVADIHFHYKRAIEAAQAGASCLRINPGNIGSKEKVREIIKSAKDNNCSLRIGINAGSLEKKILEKYKEPCPEALVESAQNNINLIEDEDFFNLKVSVKSSDVMLSIKSYRLLSKKTNYPLHLGITEAGGLQSGSIKSSIGIGTLLMEGIGDTIRVSLSADPVEEVKVGYEILKSLHLIDTVKILEEKLAHIKEPLTLSIIGCVVNGPGEAAQTQIGLTGGGQGSNMLYLSGVPHKKIASKDIVNQIVKLVEEKVEDIKKN